MKAKTIIAIIEILEQRVEAASYQYKTRKYNLEQKYETDRIKDKMTEQEKELLHNDRIILLKAKGLLEDFEKHQW